MTLSLARRRVIFGVAALAYLLSQFYRSFLTVIVDDLTRDLGIGPQAYGALGAAWFFAFSLFQFAVGAMLDTIGPRRTICGLMSFAVVGAFLFAGATTQNVALFAMVLIGIGCSPVLMGTLYFFAKTEPPQRFAALGSVFLSCGLIGSLVSATPLALLVDGVGWRDAIRIFGVITAVVAVGLFFVFRDPEVEAAPPGGSLIGDLVTLLKVPAMLPILVMSFVISAPVFTERSLWVGPFFTQVYGLGPIASSHVVLFLALAMTLSAMFSGPIAGRLDNPRAVVIVANLVGAATFLALGLWGTPPLAVALVLLGLVGLFGVTYAVLLAHGRLFMPAHVIGRGITFINFVSIGGTGVAQFFSGMAVEKMRDAGWKPAEIFSALHIAFAAMLVIALVVYRRSPRKPTA
jgi:predicted MFS family arabinose efflux permease